MLATVLTRAVGAGAALALGAAGCAAQSSSSVTTPGKNLTIYSSLPSGAAASGRAQDVLDAERLALKQVGSQFDGFTLTLRPLDDATISDNARTAIEDKNAIAYLGEIVPGQSADSIGITNALQLPEISPTDTAQALTQATPAVSGSPKVYYEDFSQYGQTFVRLVPTTAQEASALVQEMQRLGVDSLYVSSDGSDYGNALAASIRHDAGSITLRSSAAGADAVLEAGSSETAAARTFDAAAAGSPGVKLFAPSALDDQAFVSMLSPLAQSELYVSAPGFLTSQMTSQGRAFVSAFQAAYGHTPVPAAIFGYEAMTVLLSALHQAGSAANDRGTVLHDLLGLRESSSAIGAFSFDSSGDISLTGPFLISHVKSGQLVPFTSIEPTG